MDVLDRFAAKVQVDPESGCHVWTSSKNQDGYGRFKVGGKFVRAHRFAYANQVAPIPEGLVIDHLCRNRVCVNVEHLRAVTPLENMYAEGSLSWGNVNKNKKFCPKGHELADWNVPPYKKRIGERACKACANARSRAHESGRTPEWAEVKADELYASYRKAAA